MSQVDPALRSRSRAAMLLFCSGLLPVALAAQTPPAVTLSPVALPAAGRGIAELAVADFGRYAIAVASPQGTALQVIDRMSGAGELAGEAGKSDGRLDLFLDRGTVRVVTLGSKLATGEARLAVTPFRERHAGTALRLVEGKPVDDELADFEQLSWWLEIPKRRRVVFEAAGRNLADLRLWQNGSWLVDAAPAVSVVEPQSGRPLRLCQLAADLAPGLYRLTAYGGPEIAWSKSGVERPFHLRFGWPHDAQTLRERRTVSPFGFDRALVSGVADFFRLELPEAPADGETAGLELMTLDESDPFATGGPSSTLTKENVPPVAELRTAVEPGGQIVVTVRGTAGQPYVLQHFARTRERELNARTPKSAYWVSTVHAGPVGDAIDPTAILVRAGTGKPGANRLSEVLAGETVVLSRAAGWARRFNLLAPATVFVQVQEAGTYRLQSRGVAAQFRLEPLFLDGAPQGYEAPPAKSAPAEWLLDPGYYRLAMAPVEGGIAEVELAAKGAPPVALAPGRPTVQLGIVTLSSKLGYHLYVSDQPGVESGLVVRELPLDLAAALPLALGPGEEIELPVRAAERSRLRALTEDGGGLELSVDGGGWKGNSGNPADTADSVVEKGEHRVRVRSTSDATVLASIGLVSEAALAAAPQPEMPAATIAALPDFPHLSTTASPTLDLEAGEARTFLVTAEDAALYRIESTGLLATAGALRTRTRASLLAQEENGIGRNFALAAYLREGDYQLTVRPRGASAGHLGLELARAPIEEGGNLAPGIPARAAVDPRRALAFRLVVAAPGHYRFLAWGLRHDFPMRLEDADGWPVAAPLADGNLDLDLEPGDYRLIVLPQSVPARVLVVAQREEKPQELSGHGPHALALDQEAANLWLEPEEGAPREADLWRFTLPAPTVVTIRLSGEMQGELRARSANPAPGSAAAILGFVPPGRELRSALAAGDYELAATSSRQNNRLRYQVAVRSEDLVDGGVRPVFAPGELTLAVGAEAQVELSSFGRQDVRATLMTALGEPIAASDDRPGDWNFLLSKRLAPGRYRLRVDAVGTEGAAALVAMRVLRERTAEPLVAAASAANAVFEIAEDAVLVPLTRAAGAEILAVGARGEESLGMVLEERQSAAAAGAGSWRALTSTSGRAVRLALALAPTTEELRLRIWSLDRRPATVELSAYAGKLAHRSEVDLARGFDLTRFPGVEPQLAGAVVDLAEPGCFRRAASGNDEPVLMQALAVGAIFERAAPTLAPVGLALPLATALEDGASLRVQARRARVGEGEALDLALPAGTPITCDVADGGAAVVRLEALGGEPVVGFLDGRGGVGPATALTVGSGAVALSAKSAGKGRAVELWNAGETAVEARLSGWLASPLAPRSLAWGPGDHAVSARGAVLLELPPGEKELRLTLSAGTAVLALAAGSADTDAEALVWAPLDAATETLISGSPHLLLLGGEEASGVVSLELLPPSGSAGAETLRLFTGRERFEKRFSSAGVFRLTVAGAAAGSAQRIHVRGAGAAVFLGGDGRVERGSDFSLSSAGGSLRFEHGPGLVSAWIDDEEGTQRVRETGLTEVAASWGIDSTIAARSLTLPATVDLTGAVLAVEVEVAAPSLLKLRGTSPLAVALLPAVSGSAAGTARFEVFPDGARFDAVLAAGKSRLILRGLAGETLSGSATLVAERLAPLAEGLGAESLLAPGDSRGYSFHIGQPGPVGVGVRADQGGVETILFSGSGARIGQGVVQWLSFEAGDFVLVLTAPPTGRPALVRPALVGSAPPGSGPPPEEARRFLALAAGEAPAIAGVAGAENLPRDWLGAPTSEGDDSSYESESGDENDEGEATDDEGSSDESDEGE